MVADGLHSGRVVDLADLPDLARLDQRENRSGRARPGGATGPMQVVLVIVRRVVVHDQADVIDMNAAGGHVGGDQDPGIAAAVKAASARWR